MKTNPDYFWQDEHKNTILICSICGKFFDWLEEGDLINNNYVACSECISKQEEVNNVKSTRV